jgi:hypothetical protein
VSRPYYFLLLELVADRLLALLDMDEGSIGSMKELGVTESYKLKRQVVLSATEAAEMIIR